MLAHAAYFLDPLFSGGNAHTLLTVERLGRILRDHWERPSLQHELGSYSRNLLREVNLLDRLIHGCYRSFGRFRHLTGFVMDYFAAAIHCEHRRRAGAVDARGGFLLADSAGFRAAVRRHHAMLTDPTAEELHETVARDLSPINVAGLCDPSKRNMYPFA
jgi:FADH2 O2-dependent halogenase